LYQNFLCPHCRDFALDVLPSVINDYVKTGRVKIVFHDVAFGGNSAETAHDAAHCAGDQGKFWSAYLTLYENFSEDDTAYAKDKLASLLDGAGLDGSKITACLAGDQHLAEVNSATDAFTHLADNDAALANENATGMAEQLPGIPMLTIGARHLIAPE